MDVTSHTSDEERSEPTLLHVIQSLEKKLAMTQDSIDRLMREQETHTGNRSSDPVAIAKTLVRVRRRRDALFEVQTSGALKFGEPAWDILLDLYIARASQKRISVSSLCIAAAVPATTALRTIGQLVDIGLIERQADASDGRRAFIELSAETAAAMDTLFTGLDQF